MSDEWRAELLAVFADEYGDHSLVFVPGLEAVARLVLADPHRWRAVLDVPYPAVEVYPPVPDRVYTDENGKRWSEYTVVNTEDIRAIAARVSGGDGPE